MPTKTNESRRLKADGPRPAPTDESPDDRAVSPVIGVILMVAIAVIMAAVVGTFVLGQTQAQTKDVPSVSASVDELDDDANTVTLRHEGGDLIRPGEFNVLVTVGDSAIEFDDSAAGSAIWGPGDTLTIELQNSSQSNAGIDSGADYYATGSDTTTLDEGDRVTVRFTHVETGRTVMVLQTEVK